MDYDLEKKQLSSDKIVKFIEIQKDSVKRRLVEVKRRLEDLEKK